MQIPLFPFAEYWWFYLAFTGFVLFLLILDLGVFHKKARTVSLKEAGIWSVVWISLALVFNYLLYQYTLWKELAVVRASLGRLETHLNKLERKRGRTP